MPTGLINLSRQLGNPAGPQPYHVFGGTGAGTVPRTRCSGRSSGRPDAQLLAGVGEAAVGLQLEAEAHGTRR